MKPLWEHKNKIYLGPTAPETIRRDLGDELIANGSTRYSGQKKRNGVLYSRRRFIYWWIWEAKRIGLDTESYNIHVGRIDHSKPYAIGNICIQDAIENTQERNARRGNPGKSRKVKAFFNNKIKIFKSKKEAAAFFKCSEKTIYNHAHKRTAKGFSYGPNPGRNLRFEFI